MHHLCCFTILRVVIRGQMRSYDVDLPEERSNLEYICKPLYQFYMDLRLILGHVVVGMPSKGVDHYSPN